MSQSATPPGVFGGLDRDAATRMSDEALQQAWCESGTSVLCVREGPLLPFRGSEDHPTGLVLIPAEGERTPEHFYLGRIDGAPVFAIATTEDGGLPEPSAMWLHPFAAASHLDSREQELMTVALAVVSWHRSMPFSPRDGELTAIAQGGWARVDAHGGEHFPRTDPAVIVLIEHEDRLLLGSNVLWEAGRFSLLAGFVEAGESAEQAVIREIHEEAGVLVDQVRYVASQPWPFPRSLMLGFRARLATGVDPNQLSRDAAEISELRWFTRDELREPAPGLLLPGQLSIARWLIDLWIAEGDSGE